MVDGSFRLVVGRSSARSAGGGPGGTRLSQAVGGRPGATSGQGRSRSAIRARSNSSCSSWWRPMTCSPTGSPSTVPAGMDTAGLPVRLAGMVRAPLLPMARVEAVLGDQVDLADRGGHGPGGTEGDVRVGGAEDEVGLLEQVGHLLVDVDPEHLGGAGGLHVEVVGGQVHAQLDLGGEVVVAVRVAVPELPGQADQVGHGPLEAALGQLDHDVDPGEAGVGDEGLGRLQHHASPPGAPRWPRPRSIEITARLPARSKESRPASQPSTRGRLRVSRGSNPLQTSNQRAVSRTERDTQPDHHGQRRLEGARAPGDAPVGRLEPEQAGEPGRDADRAAPVAPAGDGEQATGHGGRRPPRGAARGALGIPRVAGGAVQLGAGAVDPAELRGGGLAGQHGAGGPQPGHLGGVQLRHPVGEDQRGLGVGPARHLLELLYPHGHATEGEGDVGRGRRGPGGVGVEVAEGVEPRGLDGGQRGIQGLGGREGPGPEGVDQRAGIVEPGLIGHGPDATSAAPGGSCRWGSGPGASPPSARPPAARTKAVPV